MTTTGVEPRVSRNALVSLLESYLDALRAKKPQALDLGALARFTENGQLLVPGQGLWTTVQSVADEPFVLVADVAAGTVVAFTWVHEVERPVVLVTRLGTVAGRICEIETIVSRGTYSTRFGTTIPESSFPRRRVFDEQVSAERRASRWELADATDLYLEAIERGDGSFLSVTDECRRLENGIVCARNMTGEGMPETASRATLAMSVAGQMSRSQVSKVVERARDRRFAAIDEERGAVVMFFFFDHRQFGVITHPNSLYAGEAFKHVDRQIVHIEAGWEHVPYGMKSGWES